jgi:hypothetical protein
MLEAGEPWEQLVDDPTTAAAVVEETLRYDLPVTFTARVPHVEVELGTHTLAPDTTVLAMLGAAGRDPAVHTDPDTFDPARTTAAEHLAFSGGIHYCLGAPLARLEAPVALTALGCRGCDDCRAPRAAAPCCSASSNGSRSGPELVAHELTSGRGFEGRGLPEHPCGYVLDVDAGVVRPFLQNRRRLGEIAVVTPGENGQRHRGEIGRRRHALLLTGRGCGVPVGRRVSTRGATKLRSVGISAPIRASAVTARTGDPRPRP